MFTFSFGSAFGANAVVDNKTTHAEAMTQAEKEIVDDFNKSIANAKAALADEYKETEISADCTIAGSVYAATLDEIAKDFANVVSTAAKKVDAANAAVTTVSALKAAILGATEIDTKLVYDNAAIEVAVATYPQTASGLVTFVTTGNSQETLNKYYTLFTWNNAVSEMKAYLNGEIEKIDMSLYTSDVADKDDPFEKTWAQLAQEAKDDLLKAVSDAEISMAIRQSEAKAELGKMYTTVLNSLEAYDTVETISGDPVVISYKLKDAKIKTKEDLANSDATDAADQAKLIAMVQAKAADAYAAAVTTYNNAIKGATTAGKKAAKEALDAAKEKIDAYTDNRTFLIKEGVIKDASRIDYSDFLGTACLERQGKYEALEDAAAAYKLQVEKDGSLKYDASVIDENLADAKPIIYNGDDYAKEKLVKDAENVPSNLAWEKEVEVAKLKDAMEDKLYDGDGCEKYYAPEKAKVEAAYQKVIDKINATTTSSQLKKLDKSVSLTGIDNKEAVNTKLKGYLNTGKFVDAVNNYVSYLNIGLATYDDAYRTPLSKQSEDDMDDVAEFLAENAARTNADVAGLLSKAEEYAKAITTNAEAKAEKAAVDELAKALPNVITLADKDAVKATWEAADAAGYYPAKITTAVRIVMNAEKDAIEDMIDALPKTITVADKAAVNAILDAIEALGDEAMYANGHTAATLDRSVQAAADAAFEDLRAAEKAAVEATIAALPTDATSAQVEAARADVDAFVTEYTDAHEPYQAIDKIANLDKLTFLEAQVKANQIAAVEGLKITASSTAKKGSITVKWTVEGEADIDGYRVYRSVKKNSGFGTKPLFKTTKQSYKNTKNLKKGTKYYYKVRAYKVVDGKTYYSDWSNKANRKAK